METKKWTKCGVCDGEGKIDEEACPVCRGEGKVILGGFNYDLVDERRTTDNFDLQAKDIQIRVLKGISGTFDIGVTGRNAKETFKLFKRVLDEIEK